MPALQAIVAPETAGDPSSEQKWVRSSLRTLSGRLQEVGHTASPPTVGRLLTKLGYALHVNAKKIEARAHHPDRNAQFDHIAQQRQAFTAAGWPIISVDTKKKELIGAFKNNGRAWSTEAETVNVHDFLSAALGRAVPYGIYDPTHNRGTVYGGSWGDTAQFAVDAIAQWWQTEGQTLFPQAAHLLILADGGGSNDCRSRLWKQQIQEHLCDGLGLTVTVAHYPTGCSKWNPVEHRLFGPISVNWAGKPLRTVDTLLAYIRGTTTTTGLEVRAERLDGVYPTGQRVSDAEMAALHLTKHEVCPAWNDTLYPRSAVAVAAGLAVTAPNQEVIV
jgi:dipeptidyl aminopeptidase/acylaminoacyl peptidase